MYNTIICPVLKLIHLVALSFLLRYNNLLHCKLLIDCLYELFIIALKFYRARLYMFDVVSSSY